MSGKRANKQDADALMKLGQPVDEPQPEALSFLDILMLMATRANAQDVSVLNSLGIENCQCCPLKGDCQGYLRIWRGIDPQIVMQSTARGNHMGSDYRNAVLVG